MKWDMARPFRFRDYGKDLYDALSMRPSDKIDVFDPYKRKWMKPSVALCELTKHDFAPDEPLIVAKKGVKSLKDFEPYALRARMAVLNDPVVLRTRKRFELDSEGDDYFNPIDVDGEDRKRVKRARVEYNSD